MKRLSDLQDTLIFYEIFNKIISIKPAKRDKKKKMTDFVLIDIIVYYFFRRNREICLF